MRGLVGARNAASPLISDPGRAGVLFYDSARLIVYAVAPDSTHLAARAQAHDVGSHRLTVLVVDVESGRVLASRNWNTTMRRSSVHAIAGGIVIQTGALLFEVSANLQDKQGIHLPQVDSILEWIVSSSPTGDTILVNRYNNQASHLDILQSPDLRPTMAWQESPPLRRLYSISDDRIVAADFNQSNIISKLFGGTSWKLITGEKRVGCIGSPRALNKELLANTCKSFDLVSFDGRVVKSERVDENEGFDEKIAMTKSGDRVVVSIGTTKGHNFWDTGAIRMIKRRLAVYDVIKKSYSFALDVIPLPNRDYDYAITPDGAALAVLTDDYVSLFRVSFQ